MIRRSTALLLFLPLALLPVTSIIPATAAETMVLDVCPSDYGGFPADAPAMNCGCDAEAAKTGKVFGANPYYWQTSICRAAVHAGILSARGGQILVTPAPVQPVYPAVTRNGVSGVSWQGGSDNQGFKIAAMPGAAPAPAPAPPAPIAPAPTPIVDAPAPVSTPTATMTIDVCPSNYGSFPAEGPSVACGCQAEDVKAGKVFGGNPYYWQSSVCMAAAHAGVIGASGGQVVVTPAPVQPVFPAVTRNGIVGVSWWGGSDNRGFEISAPQGTAGARPASRVEASAAGLSVDVCPSSYSSFTADVPSLSCGCPAGAEKIGKVFGANPYYWQSSVCMAAKHAGLIGADGGRIVVSPVPAQPVFPAVTRNGVAGVSWQGGADNQGFEVAAAPGAGTIRASRVEPSAEGLSLDVCPSSYASFPAEGPSLTCGCKADAVKAGKVFGANPYYWQSSVCMAAAHAGIIAASGGRIIITPALSPVFPAVKRNGIASVSWQGGPDNQGFRIAGAPGATRPLAPAPAPIPAPRVDNAGQPVQAPVAQTLRETGQVALYIRFRFNSADLDISGAPTLMQLRDALLAAPDLRLALVGHTDAVGGRDYNRNLSLKRAEAVMLWLRDQGIPAQRLAIDGQGFDEPIADNETESGRALNRRVQAIRIP